MKKEYHHFAFGLFIEEVLKCEKVGISAMCQAIGMSNTIAKSKNSRPKNKMCH